jgi:L-amino acid N-acyltransferase YncA
MDSGLQVRRAETADARAIALVHVQAWREAYARFLPAETLAGLDVEARAERWASIIGDGGDTTVWVAILDGAIVGWASAGPGRDEGAPRPLELEGIYVLASVYGSGAGQALLDVAIGAAPAYLWVAAENPRAGRFYERNGFRLDGTTDRHPLAGIPVDIARMVR